MFTGVESCHCLRVKVARLADRPWEVIILCRCPRLEYDSPLRRSCMGISNSADFATAASHHPISVIPPCHCAQVWGGAPVARGSTQLLTITHRVSTALSNRCSLKRPRASASSQTQAQSRPTPPCRRAPQWGAGRASQQTPLN